MTIVTPVGPSFVYQAQCSRAVCCQCNIILPHIYFFLVLSKQRLDAEPAIPAPLPNFPFYFSLIFPRPVCHTHIQCETPPAQSNICLSVIGRRLCLTEERGCSQFRAAKRPMSASAGEFHFVVRQLCQIL